MAAVGIASVYCLFKAMLKYNSRTGKRGWFFSTFDVFKMNREEWFWYLVAISIALLWLPVMLVFFR